MVSNLNSLLRLIHSKFGSGLQYLELPTEWITAPVLHEIGSRCPQLRYLTLDFSTAMQLYDFNDLNVFPCNLKYLCICLSEVIFMEGFMRRIYACLSSLEILHLVGTIENSNDPEDEIYEVINISKIKAHTPNLRVINFYGISFVEDTHIDAIANGCASLECLALNYCTRVRGATMKTLVLKCRRLKSLLLQNTGIESVHMKDVDWKQSAISELDLASTELNSDCLLEMFTKMPGFRYLAVPHCEGFTDAVLEAMIVNGKLDQIQAMDLSYTVNLSVEGAERFLRRFGRQLLGFIYTGKAQVTEQFWTQSIPYLRKIRILSMGTEYGTFRRISTRIHVDQLMEACAQYCTTLERMEIRWDPDTLRFSDKSNKFVDHIRLRCTRLKSLVLSDGEYYEMVKSNFERADRRKTVRTTTAYWTSMSTLLTYYNNLLFN